jgi:hypothetical protein
VAALRGLRLQPLVYGTALRVNPIVTIRLGAHGADDLAAVHELKLPSIGAG